ncbi:MAG: hypothetical protein ACK42Z_09490 [Candidatus Kapaibacteriota bacterium]
MENSQISLEELRENDLFDNIAESLFQIIVLSKIENHIKSKYNFLPPIPKYGFFYKDYAKTSFFEVLPTHVDYVSGTYVFVMLSSKEKPFDTVICNLIDNNGKVLKRNIEIPFEKVEFKYCYPAPEGNVTLPKEDR